LIAGAKCLEAPQSEDHAMSINFVSLCASSGEMTSKINGLANAFTPVYKLK
jgi:hypothetical protein